MSDILKQSCDWKKEADVVLKQSGIVNILKKFGEIKFTGSYAADLMMGGDIDIYVINKNFSKKKVLEIFHEVAIHCSFQGLLFFDWKKNKHPDFPSAYYIGLKTRNKNDVKWKIDVWFLKNTDLKKIKYTDLNNLKLTNDQRTAILRFKEYRNNFFQNLSSAIIYDAVLKDNIFSLNDFKKYIKNINIRC
jgi:hypothetical protein